MTTLSNRQRRQARKRTTKAPASPSSGVTTTSRAMVAAAVDIPQDRDGLLWLISRNRLTPPRARAAKAYRQDFREASSAGPTLKSCLDVREGYGKGLPASGPTGEVIYALDAQRSLFRKRFAVLRGQADLLDVLDGVCGRGLTLRELAGGNGHKAASLETLLKVALDLLAQGDLPRE